MIYDHLELDLGFNYLAAGDGLDNFDDTFAPANADDAYELFWRLLYTF
jgi:hypothetical protein